MAFKQITPIAFRSLPAIEKKETDKAKPQASPKSNDAKLIIETSKEKMKIVEEVKEVYKTATAPSAKKISSLDSIRRQFDVTGCDEIIEDNALELSSLQKAWQVFIQVLKDAKNPAWQSFELAQLIIIGANSFEAIVTNNINQKFLEFERNKACAFLQKKLCNKALKFSILITNAPHVNISNEHPLNAKEQYQKIIEQYPLVKELRDRLRLELDY